MPKEEGFKKSHILFLVGIGSLALLVAVLFFRGPHTSMQPTLVKSIEEEAIKEEASQQNTGAGGTVTSVDVINLNPTPGDQIVLNGVILAGRTSPLLAYSEEDFPTAMFSDRLVVLYFYSDICTKCATEFTHIQNVFDGITDKRVVGFRVMMNDATSTDHAGDDLAARLGITKPGTKMLFRNGRTLGRTADTWDENQYKAEIADALKE